MAQKFAWARQAEILRSDEKDRQHLDSTRRDIFDALIELIGLRRIVRHHQVGVLHSTQVVYNVAMKWFLYAYEIAFVLQLAKVP